MNSHILEVKSEDERRKLLRRQSDLSTGEKGRRFDALMLDAKFKFEFCSELAQLAHGKSRSTNGGAGNYYHGQAHAYSSLLFYADIKVECPCGSCVQQRAEPTTRKPARRGIGGGE